MEKFKNIQDYLDNNGSTIVKREELKDMLLRCSLRLLSNCAHNFDGAAEATELLAEPLFILNDMLDKVE